LASGIMLLIFPVRWFPSFYDVRYMGIGAVICVAAIIFLPKIFFVPPDVLHAEKKNKTADLFQLGFAVAVINNALGDMGLYQLYKVGFEYDKFIHLTTSFLAVLIIAVVLEGRFEVRVFYSILVALIIVVFAGLFWELFEYLSDVVFKTHLYGVYGVNINSDTQFDILSNTFGAIIGALVLFLKRKRIGFGRI
jgi:hypothetical protein